MQFEITRVDYFFFFVITLFFVCVSNGTVKLWCVLLNDGPEQGIHYLNHGRIQRGVRGIQSNPTPFN